jgi:hypothetical protein
MTTLPNRTGWLPWQTTLADGARRSSLHSRRRQSALRQVTRYARAHPHTLQSAGDCIRRFTASGYRRGVGSLPILLRGIAPTGSRDPAASARAAFIRRNHCHAVRFIGCEEVITQ